MATGLMPALLADWALTPEGFFAATVNR